MSYEKMYIIAFAGDDRSSIFELINKFITGNYKNSRMVIGITAFTKEITVEGIGTIHLQIRQSGSTDRFHLTLPLYLKGVNGIMFVFSTIDRQMLSQFDNWLMDIRKIDPNLPILLVGTNIDLEEKRQVELEEAIELARSRDCAGYIEVSAKEGTNVDQAFEKIRYKSSILFLSSQFLQKVKISFI